MHIEDILTYISLIEIYLYVHIFIEISKLNYRDYFQCEDGSCKKLKLARYKH